MLVICLSLLHKTRDTPNRVNREVPKILRHFSCDMYIFLHTIYLLYLKKDNRFSTAENKKYSEIMVRKKIQVCPLATVRSKQKAFFNKEKRNLVKNQRTYFDSWTNSWKRTPVYNQIIYLIVCLFNMVLGFVKRTITLQSHVKGLWREKVMPSILLLLFIKPRPPHISRKQRLKQFSKFYKIEHIYNGLSYPILSYPILYTIYNNDPACTNPN
jgi:hypothetical protein